MTKLSKFAALALLGAITAGTAHAEDKTVAKVNGAAIPESRLDMRVSAIVAQGQPDSPDLRKAVREDLINVELMAQEAVKMGLDKHAETQQQLELARQAVLVDAFVQNYAKTHPVSEAELKQEYDRLKASLGSKEFKVRHILVDDEATAKSIAAKLKKGEKFEKLAEANSKDVGSREKGGELGWSVPTNYVKPFADALGKLLKGQVSEPVQSQFGWHIIRLDDVRDLKMPPLEELKPQLTQRLQQQAVKDLITDLRNKAKID